MEPPLPFPCPGGSNMSAWRGRSVSTSGPFSLEQAIHFLNGFAPAGVSGQQTAYRQAHVINGKPLLLTLLQEAQDRLALRVQGPDVSTADLDGAERLARRVFSLDWDGEAFYGKQGAADPVLRRLQARYPGLRPVLFGSPFEALCWAILGHRIRISQAARLKARLAEALGPKVEALGTTWQAFPAPTHLMALEPEKHGPLLGIPQLKLERLSALARRGVAGELEAEHLLSMPVKEARAWLEKSPGIGPWGSEFALIRGAGHPDLIPAGEHRLRVAIQRYYGLTHEPGDDELARLGQRWAGARSWAAFLLRVALQEDTGEIKGPSCGAMEGIQSGTGT